MKTIQALYRYPVKGLSEEVLQTVTVEAGSGFPLDRAFAITNGSWQFDAATYRPRPKTDFLALTSFEKLAALRTYIDANGKRLTVRIPAGEKWTAETLQVALDDAASLENFSDFLSTYLPGLPGRPRLIKAWDCRFTDASVLSPRLMSSVSLINLASVRELARGLGKPVQPLRFRANIYFEGEPFEEFAWLDKKIRIGALEAQVLLRTPRCAATNVNPDTAERDLQIPQALIERFGHRDLGCYAEIITGGVLHAGDVIEIDA